MIGWLKNHWKPFLGVPIFGALCFLAGQFIPSFFDNYFSYVNAERQELSTSLVAIKARGDALESKLRLVVDIARDVSTADAATLTDFEESLLQLYQAIEGVKAELPEAEQERDRYVKALVALRGSANRTMGSLDGRQLFEALSEYKDARTKYEERVAAIEPGFITSVLRKVR